MEFGDFNENPFTLAQEPPRNRRKAFVSALKVVASCRDRCGDHDRDHNPRP